MAKVTLDVSTIFHYEVFPDDAGYHSESRVVDKIVPDGKGGLMKTGEKERKTVLFQKIYVYTGSRFPHMVKYFIDDAAGLLKPGKYLPGDGHFIFDQYGNLKFGFRPVLVPFPEDTGK